MKNLNVTGGRAALARTALRLGVIVALAVFANLGLNFVLAQLDGSTTAGMQIALTSVVIVSLIFYALLVAIPFVPGLEIGLSLMMMKGVSIAPFVFLATLGGLTLAYLVGRYLPDRLLYNLFADLRLKSACRLIDRLRPLDQQSRLDMLQARLPKYVSASLLRYRYVTIAILLNIPGNALIGGGGGIALISGLSRTFSTRGILLTFAIAVSPVPLAVYFFGLDIFSLFN
ncbi:MAG: hypothetical protein GXP05_15610 [Alphaproteobacteria bacterium]|nr:hypothetical protein [Alphaproteobacteria bacterium]